MSEMDRERRLRERIAAITGIEREYSARLLSAARQRVKQGPEGTLIGHESQILDELAAEGWWWGEVIGYNRFYAAPIRQVVRAWMASTTHRAVLVDPRRYKIGAAIHVQWTTGRWWYVAIVGRP